MTGRQAQGHEADSTTFTIGVEEEYQIVDPETRALRGRAERVLPEAQKTLGEEVQHELLLSQLETATLVCRDLAAVRHEVTRLRREVIAAAAHHGSEIAAAGTHPFSRWQAQEITPKDRYLGLERDYARLARELVICGCHVHIGFDDPEGTVRLPATHPTIEFRVADVCATVDEAVMLAGLARSDARLRRGGAPRRPLRRGAPRTAAGGPLARRPPRAGRRPDRPGWPTLHSRARGRGAPVGLCAAGPGGGRRLG